MKTVTPLSADSHLLVRSHLFTSEEINVILLPLKYEIFFSCTALQLLKIGAFVFLKFYPSSHMTEEPGMIRHGNALKSLTTLVVLFGS